MCAIVAISYSLLQESPGITQISELLENSLGKGLSFLRKNVYTLSDSLG